MDEISQRRAKKLEEEKLKTHTEGEAVCLYCWHEFVAEVPTGYSWLWCPHCNRAFARFQATRIRPGEAHFECLSCSSDIWRITPNGAYCVDCGAFAPPTDYS